MTELKTLEDYWRILPVEELAFSNKTDVTLHSLRAEAIKWIKTLRTSDQTEAFENCKDYIGLILWIKHFFNIKEEELK